MAVRNFWIEAKIDGRETKLAGGPQSKTGGASILLYQRNKGEIEKAVKIICSENAGKLKTEVLLMENVLQSTLPTGEITLLPCPVCGGKARLFHQDESRYMKNPDHSKVMCLCGKCWLTPVGTWFSSEEIAAEMWNESIEDIRRKHA